jgi:hypothetical protein
VTEIVHEIVVVGVDGAEQQLATAGVTGIAVLDGVDLSESVFDESTHTWALPSCRARVIVTDQIRSGRDDLAPYLGVAVYGAPNYFMVTGDESAAAARLGYIGECLALMRQSRGTRIEVLYSSQRTFHMRGADRPDRTDASYWQRMAKAARTAFDVSSHIGVVDEVYDGPATIGVGDDEHLVRVRLSGRLDPIDGRYHWQGTILDALPDGTGPRPVTVTIGEQTAEARITERTQQGGYSVAGVGMPPYALDDVEVVVPLR